MASSLPHSTRPSPRLDRVLNDFGRQPLGSILIERGLLTRQRLDVALDEAQRTGRRIGEVLVDRGWAFENELSHVLAKQHGLPYLDIEATKVDPEAAAMLPRDFAEHFLAVPVRITGSGAVLVAVADPADVDLETIGIALGRPIELGIADLSAIRNAWKYCP